MNTFLSVLKDFRSGLYARPGLSGMLIATLAIVVVARLVVWATEATGPSTPARGSVERIYVASEDQHGPSYGASVRLDTGAHVNVHLGTVLSCDVGNPILVWRKPTHFGVTYVPDAAPCLARSR